ncbi:hydroxyacylglutathione hydrolase [Piscinibacter koreensis]|uniref:Hydroxyacylglutathione hydrolase n=1 Tax=Piscinibacter koreensis TaxID=2742824 RepID=A0A7Y6TY12_9BURK|nr:hydroxyacylglutathione hydrolase [Schlegelella koreensis]NUZ07728.1 hydroxyacylglutathione hydrolase [Schlegelella koreensis]
MNLTALPAFSDNYIWMMDDGRSAIIVDPGEAAPVHAALDARGLALAAILVTHHHGDHCGGVDALRGRLQGEVYGPRRETIPQPAIGLGDGDQVEVLGMRFDVYDIPGHTAGHIAFHRAASNGEPGVLFCGDTLFSAGCGRLFEGTPAQMHESLSTLARLPGDSRVCCGHEYTLSNLRFAQAVEPANRAIAEYTVWCEAERAAGRPTLPSTLAREAEVNPFLRCSEPAVVAAAAEHGAADSSGVAVLAALRNWKNDFR